MSENTTLSVEAAAEQILSLDEGPDEDTPETEPDAAPPAEEEESDEAPDDVDEESDDEPGPDDEPEESDSDESADKAAPVETLADLAKRLKMDEAALGKIKVNVKIDGQDQQVTVSEALQGYQRQADYTRKTQELASVRKSFGDRDNLLERETTALRATLGQLRAPLMERYKQLEANTALRATDPGKWAADLQVLSKQIATFDGIYNNHVSSYEKYLNEQSEKYATTQRELLDKARPDWRDHEGRVVDTLLSLGLSAQELETLVDHRLVLAALELAELREAAKTKVAPPKPAPAAKKVPAPPPRAPKRAAAGPGIVRNKAMSQLKKSGSLEDAAKLLALED